MPGRSVLALSATLVLSAFASIPGRADAPKACDLFSAQAAMALTGAPVQNAMNAPIVCAYTSESNSTQANLTVSTVTSDFGPKYVKVAHDGPIKGELLSGVGDEAFFAVQPNDMNVIIAFSHLKMINLSVKKKLDPALKAAMIQAVKQIVAKL